MACEELHPFGIELPDGLPALLHNHLDQVQRHFEGRCFLEVTGPSLLPIEPAVQYEVYKIASEAIANAVQHADANEIKVTVTYPQTDTSNVILTIQDNGQNATALVDKPLHHGLRSMRRRSSLIGAHLSFEVEPRVGTAVTLDFPRARIIVSTDSPRLLAETVRSRMNGTSTDQSLSSATPRTA